MTGFLHNLARRTDAVTDVRPRLLSRFEAPRAASEQDADPPSVDTADAATAPMVPSTKQTPRGIPTPHPTEISAADRRDPATASAEPPAPQVPPLVPAVPHETSSANRTSPPEPSSVADDDPAWHRLERRLNQLAASRDVPSAEPHLQSVSVMPPDTPDIPRAADTPTPPHEALPSDTADATLAARIDQLRNIVADRTGASQAAAVPQSPALPLLSVAPPTPPAPDTADAAPIEPTLAPATDAVSDPPQQLPGVLTIDAVSRDVLDRLKQTLRQTRQEPSHPAPVAAQPAVPAVAAAERAPAGPAMTPDVQKTVHVTIGRVDVTAPAAPSPAARSRQPSSSAARVMSLEDYIAQRSSGGIA